VTTIVPRQVRARLALWHVGMLAGVLAVYLGGVSLLLFWQAGNILKRIAAEDLETLKGLLFEPRSIYDARLTDEEVQARQRLRETISQ
jgi:hypothetical protein